MRLFIAPSSTLNFPLRRRSPSRRTSIFRFFQLAFVACIGLLHTALLAAPDKPLRVTTSTSFIADLTRQVGGPHVEVSSLMGPGIDPHLYKPTASDMARIQRADILLYTGLHLEGRMQDLLERLAKRGRRVHALGDALPTDSLISVPGTEGRWDPHVWFDPQLWGLCAIEAARRLGEAAPQHAATFHERARKYALDLDALRSWAIEQVATIPESQRVLITSHDAFNYLGRAAGLQVVALQGVSTVSEAGLADVTRLVDFIRERKVPAVFIESSVAPDMIRRISKDAGARVGGELFSDALGATNEERSGHRVDIYTGMFRYNLETVVQALR